MFFFDIGANHGYYSLLSSALVGASGSVHVFEPTPSSFSILEYNLNAKENVKLNNVAIWHSDGEIEFTDFGKGYSAYNSINSSIAISSINDLTKKCVIKVKTIVIDNYIAQSGVQPTFIKLDVEGVELQALQGMKIVLEKIKPELSVEFMVNDLWTSEHDEILKYLASYNYAAYNIENGQLVPFIVGKKYTTDHLNLIFKHN